MQCRFKKAVRKVYALHAKMLWSKVGSGNLHKVTKVEKVKNESIGVKRKFSRSDVLAVEMKSYEDGWRDGFKEGYETGKKWAK
jgi:hypothetical protein